MLVLSRKANQAINIGGDITVYVVSLGHGRARIGISAPKDVRVVRGELAAIERRLPGKEADSAHSA